MRGLHERHALGSCPCGSREKLLRRADLTAADGAVRGPAMGRMNYYGSGSLWSVCLTAAMFFVATLKRWDLNPRRRLTWYLQSCATAGGKPPAEIESFSPWNLPAKRRQELASRPDSAAQLDTS
jgi:transposase